MLVAAAASASCTQARTACGEAVPGGGPPRIVSRDGELCESVRLRVADHLGQLPSIAPEQAQLLADLTWRWEDAKTLDGFLTRVREDAGDEFAAAVARAVRDVRDHGQRPVRADCTDEERCLVKGAALGARIALSDAASILRTLRRAENRASFGRDAAGEPGR
jgi:hypothetical protein